MADFSPQTARKNKKLNRDLRAAMAGIQRIYHVEPLRQTWGDLLDYINLSSSKSAASNTIEGLEDRSAEDIEKENQRLRETQRITDPQERKKFEEELKAQFKIAFKGQ